MGALLVYESCKLQLSYTSKGRKGMARGKGEREGEGGKGRGGRGEGRQGSTLDPPSKNLANPALAATITNQLQCNN